MIRYRNAGPPPGGSERKAGGRGKYEYRVNVNHAIGALKDGLIGIPIAEDIFVRNYLYGEPVGEMRRQLVPIRSNRGAGRKNYLKKPRFHHNHKSNC
jgi:hypothetical protein